MYCKNERLAIMFDEKENDKAQVMAVMKMMKYKKASLLKKDDFDLVGPKWEVGNKCVLTYDAYENFEIEATYVLQVLNEIFKNISLYYCGFTRYFDGQAITEEETYDIDNNILYWRYLNYSDGNNYEINENGKMQLARSVFKYDEEPIDRNNTYTLLDSSRIKDLIKKSKASNMPDLTRKIENLLKNIPSMRIENGYLRSVDDSLTICVIPEGVEHISWGAFRRCNNLVEVKIPDSIKEIGENTFRYLRKLKTVTIPASIESIGANAFWGTPFEKRIADENNGLVIINNNLLGYYGNDSEIIIPDNVKYIRKEAFKNATNIKSLVIGNGVKKIETTSFENVKLDKLIINNPACEIENRAFNKAFPDTIYEMDCSYLVLLTGSDLKRLVKWEKLPLDIQAQIVLNHREKAIEAYYLNNITPDSLPELLEKLIELYSEDMSLAKVRNIERFASLFEKYIPTELSEKLPKAPPKRHKETYK